MEKQTYEEMIKSIEQVLNELDNKDIALDEAVSKYKKGIELIEECTQTLESIEKELRVIE